MLNITLLIIIILISFFLNKYKTNNILSNLKNKLKNNITIDNYYLPSNNIIKIKNIYSDNKEELYWINDIFTKNNFPSNISFDYEIKKDIIEKALNLDLNTAIIDCGAHIGDGLIPIAHALKNIGRDDITVIGIEPSIYKCKFINYLIKLNKLDNVLIINAALSDTNTKLYKKKNDIDLNLSSIIHYILYFIILNNTGAEILYNLDDCKDKNNIDFIIDAFTLDDIMKKINKKLGIIHLDVEGYEFKVISGGLNTILKDKTYISLEDHDNNPDKFIKLLGNNYSFNERINSNNTFIYK